MNTLREQVTKWFQVAQKKLAVGSRGWFMLLFGLIDALFIIVLLFQIQNTSQALTIVGQEVKIDQQQKTIQQLESVATATSVWIATVQVHMTEAAPVQTNVATVSPSNTSTPSNTTTVTSPQPTFTRTPVPPTRSLAPRQVTPTRTQTR
jgi:hypothetical protein